MKIGILTFHRAHNYGAVLQAYALQEILYSKGQEVEFIDYSNPVLMRIYKWFNIRRYIRRDLNALFHELIIAYARKKRYDHFESFIKKYINVSPIKYNLSSYDLVIIGSDQVWNTKLTCGYDKMYWGDFPHSDSLKIASYAASMEKDIKNDEETNISRLLKNFNYISVREKSLANNLSKLTDKTIFVVSDPTLLLKKERWEDLTKRNYQYGKYVLLYQVRNDSKAELIAQKVAEHLGLNLIYLSARIDLKNSREAVSSGPIEFLSLFKNASFVVCTSFHGTVFSTIFNIPFYSVLLNDGKDTRVKDLLASLNLNGRGISSVKDMHFEAIDWNNVNKRLEGLRKKSIDYIDLICQ